MSDNQNVTVMKRLYILLTVLIFVTTTTNAQHAICGVAFGQSYDVAENYLTRKFGKAEIYDHNEICYFNREYAGIPFEFIFFWFQSDGYNTYFNKCTMGREFDNIKTAKIFERKLIKELCAKYDSIDIYVDQNGYLALEGGQSPINKEKSGFCVFISSRNKKHIVFLEYGPYNYIKEEL